jgi:L-aminopeptidase/D-esterase-like protein
VQQVHAVFLSGGSAFGLDVATGVRKYLYEHKVGFEVRGARVPIVPAPSSSISTSAIGPTSGPPPIAAIARPLQPLPGPYRRATSGRVRAPRSARRPGGWPMKGGLGTASIRVAAGADSLVVAALVA